MSLGFLTSHLLGSKLKQSMDTRCLNASRASRDSRPWKFNSAWLYREIVREHVSDHSAGPADGIEVHCVNSFRPCSDPQRDRHVCRPTNHEQTPPMPEMGPVVTHAFLAFLWIVHIEVPFRKEQTSVYVQDWCRFLPFSFQRALGSLIRLFFVY